MKLTSSDIDVVWALMLVANAGHKMAYGPSVAKRVVSLAAGDRSLVGVVGLSESYQATKLTVDTLSAAGIPSVSATVSSDVFADNSTRLYFEIAPQNRSEANVVAAYAKRHVGASGPASVPVRIYRSADPEDIYSANIAADAAAAFHRAGFPQPTTLTFAPDQVNVPADFANARLAGGSWCPDKGVVFWAGRPVPDFGVFNTGLQDCGYRNGLLVLADHGMHSLRHTLATRLMEGGTPVEQIADILGHQSVKSVGVYLKSSLGLLSRCALDPDAPAREVSR